MANQLPDAETAGDLNALPADLQPLYQRLTHDGHAWRAATAERLASIAQALVEDMERLRSDGAATPHYRVSDTHSAHIELPPGADIAEIQAPHAGRRHRREWIAGTVAVVAVVALLALVLQAGLVGRGTTTPTHTNTGPWQILHKLTVKGDIASAQAPVIAPSNPQVVYEATNSVGGQGGQAGTYASLRKTDDGGATWQNVKLPLPVEAISTIQLQISPFNAQAVFMSIWDRASLKQGYVSYNGGGSWQTQQLPTQGILDLDQPFAIDQNRMVARNICDDASCLHLLMSTDEGQSWQVIDDQLTTQGNYVCTYAATPHGNNVYAVTTRDTSAPQLACARPSSDMTLWRNDDAGGQWNANAPVTHWTRLGPLPSMPERSAQGKQVSAMGGIMLSTPIGGLVYLRVAHWSDGSKPILYSEDYGVTWKSTPAFPAGARPGLEVESAATMHEGTQVIAIQDSPAHTTLYTWKPGDVAWTRLPPLPAAVSGVGTVTVAPGGSGQDTIMVTLSQTSAAGNVAYYVIRYQM